jgi:hypothetical protein
MSATLSGTEAPATAPAGRRLGLRGLTWLVWRQHRLGFWTVIALTALGTAAIVYRGTAFHSLLQRTGYPKASENVDFQGSVDTLNEYGMLLGLIPVLLGVFLGAPLIAGDLESGTAKLVSSQSVSSTRWLATKLVVTSLLVVAGTTVLSLAYNWWWAPVRTDDNMLSWIESSPFDVTGPVPVALTLFSVIGGVAIGIVLRRTLLSMVITFGFTVAVQMAWSRLRESLGTPATVTNTVDVLGDGYPTTPTGAYQVERWFRAENGDLYGWGSCADGTTEEAARKCVEEKGIVGWRVDYFPISQMEAMQWLGAGLLFALTAAVLVFIFTWGRKRLV